MSEGHRHRTIRLPANSARLHLLQTPLRRTVTEPTGNFWVRGIEGREILANDGPIRYVTVYRLTPLSILHTLFGLTVDTTPKDQP